VKAATAFRAS